MCMGMRRTLVAALLALAAVAPSASASPIYQSPGISPAGANDFSCKPTAAHPYPVVLVHGTFMDMTVSWNSMSPALQRDGYCVFALDYGHRGTDPIENSASELAAFVDHVLQTTGASKVAIVGHSQGGMMPRYYMKFLGGLEKVDELIGLAPSNHGTTNPGAFFTGQVGCDACVQQAAGSDFLNKLNAPPEAPEPTSYTVLADRGDEVVTPYTSEALSGTSVTNVVLQDRCPNDHYEHVTIPYDPVALQWVENALAGAGPADPNFVPNCDGSGTSQGANPGGGQSGGQSRPRVGATGSRGGRIRLAGGRLRLTRAHQVLVPVQCLAPKGAACSGQIGLKLIGGRGLGTATFAIRGGQTAAVRIQITQAGMKRLRHKRRARVLAAAIVNDESGEPTGITGRFTLKR
jgi:pimeloyl-ACP methyl ester carboxylesterase